MLAKFHRNSSVSLSTIVQRLFANQNSKWFDKLPKHKMILKTQAHRMLHPIYKLNDIETVELTHYEAQTVSDKLALGMIKVFRWMFDVASSYDPNNMNEGKYLFRFILLETVAGLPGIFYFLVKKYIFFFFL